MVSPTKKILLTTLLTNACRVLLAIVFMVSGFVKAVDPMGFFYKLKEYAAVFDITIFSDAWLLFFAIAVVAVEFVAGFFLLLGIYRKPVAVLVFLSMLIYTPFTLYLVIENPLSQCGCFGDALEFTNEESFAKNVFLLLMSAVVFFKTGLYRRCISGATRWLAVIFVLFYIVLVESISLWHLPVIDFRPFAIGVNLREAVVDTPSQYETVALYEKEGEQRTFAIGSAPDSTWNYIGSSSKLVTPARPATVQDFMFIDLATDYDAADDILADTGYVALLVMEQLETADESRVDKINDLYDYSREHEIDFYAATSSGEEAVALWGKRTGAEYPLYWADNDMLKTMVRANPGLLLLKDGVIVEKWRIDDVPENISASAQEGKKVWRVGYIKIMRGWRFWLLLFVVPMAFILFLDMFALLRKKGRKEPVGDKKDSSDKRENNTIEK